MNGRNVSDYWDHHEFSIKKIPSEEGFCNLLKYNQVGELLYKHAPPFTPSSKDY